MYSVYYLPIYMENKNMNVDFPQHFIFQTSDFSEQIYVNNSGFYTDKTSLDVFHFVMLM